jgi:hypothetical protein
MSQYAAVTIQPVYVNESGAAIITGIPTSKLRKDRSRGVGIPYNKFGASIRYRVSDLIEWMEQHRVVPQPKLPNPLERRGRPRKHPLIINGVVVKPATAGSEGRQ